MDGSNAPIIIKRKKVIAGGGHHGGAWKVAYADFVTAMMAFFLLMWLLNATTEQQRKGIADYFSPTIPLSRVSGGGDGVFAGDSTFANDSFAEDGTGVLEHTPDADPESQGLGAPTTIAEAQAEEADRAETAALQEIEEMLNAASGESDLTDLARRHVVTRLTDEGLVIEIFALPGTPIFDAGTAQMRPVTAEIVGMVARLASLVTNEVAIDAHLATRSLVLADNPVWDLSAARAGTVRTALEAGGLDPERVARLTGHADRDPAVPEQAAPRNDRVEIVLLRSQG
ncbi:flagellar motor protein MotB [Pseudoroseicyclus tamaricis]|uniref:OmpA family protein n=1 Tax=Pseudoroseicyclus tamaricis TaxID=2705421 RepID=A0A6B2JWL7_9RHOB|nr:flagellar motor protein MotB [Pseudoroseicyclus tamaricis]NDV02520.1 OmpA family protein [Pseudoroseicyclus tamaricis]